MRRPARLITRASRLSSTTCGEIVEGRTALIIAHRLSTVRHAHRIITIERGRIVEDGTHDQLIRSAWSLRQALSSAGGHP